jgi:uncharacterized membrane protein YfcA
MEQYLWLIPLGFVIGTYGTLIGAGGGFVLVPILLLLYPDESPEIITCISLAVVFFNALSGSLAYSRMRRIDYKSGLLFSAATIPGAILGALTTAYIPRRLFEAVFGILMIAASGFMLFRANWEADTNADNPKRHLKRNVVEADGSKHFFSFNPIIGVGISFFVGYISSLLGIGGGIIHVPALVHFLNFPVHIATATSHFVLSFMALTGTIVHIAAGVFSHGVRRTIALAIGVLFGAQLGAYLSRRVHGVWIIRGLAIALALVGLRVLIMAFGFR